MKRILPWLLLIFGVLFTAAVVTCIVLMFTGDDTLGAIGYTGAATIFFLAFLAVFFGATEEIRK